MNLEEVINQEREKAEEGMKKSIELFPSFEGRKCMESAEEHEQLAEWLEELKELRKYKEKYRWHDLRKNPADLPEDNKDVLVTIKGGCVNRTWHDSCGWRNATAKKARYYSDKSVLAWKEIEEFENDEI
jgi:hypothetical protein